MMLVHLVAGSVAAAARPILPYAWSFTAGLPAGVTFTRPGTDTAIQTVRNASGYVATLTGDTYGVDHSLSNVPLGLRAEGARTNVWSHSEEITNADNWGQAATTRTLDATTGPDNTLSGDKVAHNSTSNNQSRITENMSLSVYSEGDTYAISGWWKETGQGNNDWICFRLGSHEAVDPHVFFNIGASPGLGSNTDPARGFVEDWGNGWRRLKWRSSYNADSDGVERVQFTLQAADQGAGSVVSYAGVVGEGQFFYGMQKERLVDFASSYIPTAGASVTRNPTLAVADFALTWPAKLRIKGRTAPGIGTVEGDQVFLALTNRNSGLIEVYRRAFDRKLILAHGSKVYDLGVVGDGTDFDLTQALDGAPGVDRAYFGSNAIGGQHWFGTIHTVELA
ncbi:MAG: hypothetical protein ACFCUO_13460 [Rhodospirillales bacterium]